MDKMELYHFHKKGSNDHSWQESKIINVTPSFNNTMYKRFSNFSNTATIPREGKILYYQLLAEYIRDGVFDQKSLQHMLTMAFNISFNSNEFKRENALENNRLINTPKLPSRLHCIYLTDEKGIYSWKDKLGTSDLTLYRVEAEGNIFKTNEQLIPDELLTYNETLEASYKYWHPNFKHVPEDCNEYLTQGKIKVLEKINRI